ncbi:MAG: cytochrome c-type biogenesis protein CcmH [Gammaproteobacteria bacterium]|nr:cytochrome c-type biogenesis protein CcmH [Gammaproteobacteria bacterium]
MRAAVIVALLLLGIAPVSFANSRYPFENAVQQAQFQALLHDLRCPVCQNQDLADSNADLAADLREEVYQRVIQHQSDADIIDFLTARYGDFIIFKPSVSWTTSILWFGPGVLLLMGLGLFGMMCVRRTKHE